VTLPENDVNGMYPAVVGVKGRVGNAVALPQ
jgi:hypothetical protein